MRFKRLYTRTPIRGLALIRTCVRSDPANPLNWSRRRKVSPGGCRIFARSSRLESNRETVSLTLLPCSSGSSPGSASSSARSSLSASPVRPHLFVARDGLLLTLASVLGTRRLFDSSLERAGNFRLFQDDRPSRYHALHGHIRRTFLEQGYREREMFPNGLLRSRQAAPLLLAPLSEVYGRSYIYFVSAVVFFLCFLPQALANSIVLVLVFRFISGIAGSTAVSLVGGTLADVWRDEDRGTPIALFSFAAFGCTSPRFFFCFPRTAAHVP